VCSFRFAASACRFARKELVASTTPLLKLVRKREPILTRLLATRNSTNHVSTGIAIEAEHTAVGQMTREDDRTRRLAPCPFEWDTTSEHPPNPTAIATREHCVFCGIPKLLKKSPRTRLDRQTTDGWPHVCPQMDGPMFGPPYLVPHIFPDKIH
jgi:hypothetical protein